MVSFLGVPNFEYIGGGIGVLIFIALVWWILGKTRQGRIGEEQQEERETDRLKNDEVVVEATQRDEKKQCQILRETFNQIYEVLRHEWLPETLRPFGFYLKQINSMLDQLETEEMSVQVALETFKNLNELTTGFLSHCPMNNSVVASLVNTINVHHTRYYQDLVKEMKIDEAKKELITKLWGEVTNETKGRGQLKAA